jgi:2-polyprenyl-3-methyl-5-hydroxy-6-metoxy-1,4-benzoquinol methylase
MDEGLKMSRTYTEDKFTELPFEVFYESHYFQPVSDIEALNAHRMFPRVNWALDLAREFQPKKILDLGCLEGYAALTIAKHVDSVEAGAGVDLSHDGIELAKQRAHDYRVPIRFYEKSIESFLEHTRQEYDFIMLFEVIEHVKDPEYLLQLIDNVKTDDGLVLISTPAFESPTYGKNDVKNKCHVRLYTTADKDYEEMTDHSFPDEPQRLRQATSLSKQVGKKRIKKMDVFSQLIHCVYE